MSHKQRDVILRRGETAWIVELPPDFVAEAEESLTQAMESIFEALLPQIIVDFSSVEEMNSAGVGLLILLLHRAREKEIPVALAAMRGKPKLVIERVGLQDHIPSYGSVDEAIASYPEVGGGSEH